VAVRWRAIRPSEQIVDSIADGVISWPGLAPDERVMVSSISVTPRSLAPAWRIVHRKKRTEIPPICRASLNEDDREARRNISPSPIVVWK
jgi:hypothetical protein